MRAERAFRSPQLFRRNRPKIPCTWPDNPTHAASFSRQFSARTAHRPPRLGQKKGAFLPPTPAVSAFLPARTPRFAPAPPVFLPGARPDGAPACPVLPETPAPAHTPGTPEVPCVRLFCPPAPASARRAPPERPKVAPPAADTTPPCAACPPVAAVRRPKVSPPPRRGTALGLETPTAEVGFPASP